MPMDVLSELVNESRDKIAYEPERWRQGENRPQVQGLSNEYKTRATGYYWNLSLLFYNFIDVPDALYSLETCCH